jgi:hypothetical protein
MLANDRDRLSRGDVVTGIPILFAGSIEVLFDDLLPPRRPVPSAHRGVSLSQDAPEQRQLPFLIGMPDHRQRITTFA